MPALTRMASLVDKIRPVALLEQGERLVCASFGRSPAVGRSIVAVSDRRLFIAPRSAFLSSGAWARRRLEELRVVTTPRTRFGMVVGRRFELLDDAGESVVFEVDDPKDARAFQDALRRGAVSSSNRGGR